MLEAKTVSVNVDGVLRYATPLLCKKEKPKLTAPKEAVLPHLRGLEKHLSKNLELAKAFNQEIAWLEQSGYAVKLAPEAVDQTSES